MIRPPGDDLGAHTLRIVSEAGRLHAGREGVAAVERQRFREGGRMVPGDQ